MQNDELLERAAFGRQVELFWGSAVGGYLRERARTCYSDAIQELKSVDPTDTRAVMRAQANVWKAEEFERWLSEAVLDGLKALDLLEGNDSDE